MTRIDTDQSSKITKKISVTSKWITRAIAIARTVVLFAIAQLLFVFALVLWDVPNSLPIWRHFAASVVLYVFIEVALEMTKQKNTSQTAQDHK